MKNRTLHRHTESGFSLVELIVVLVLLGILMSIATLNFNQWMNKSNLETQVRKMVIDLSEIRVMAFTTKKRHSFTINQSSYAFKSYSSEDEDKCTGGTVLPGRTVNVDYKLKKASGAYYSGSCADVNGDTIEIDSRGMLSGSLGNTIVFEYSNLSPVVDCVKIHVLRINPGKYDGSTCNDN